MNTNEVVEIEKRKQFYRCDACKSSHTDNYPNCKAKVASK